MLSQDAYFGIELLMHSKKFLLAALAEFFVVRAAHAGEHASRAGPHRTATGPGGVPMPLGGLSVSKAWIGVV